MDTLFEIDPIFPNGFSYEKNFISVEEENFLISFITSLQFETFKFHGFEAKRKVCSFGYDYSFEGRSVSRGKKIPDEFNFLIEKIATHLNLSPQLFEELLVTEYDPGTVINWHRDAPPFELIAGVSLMSNTVFKLRPLEKTSSKRKAVITFPLLRRSLYSMQQEARENWEHSIPAVKEKRYSITLRTMKNNWQQ